MRAALAVLLLALACAPDADPRSYRLAGTGESWADTEDRFVVAELRQRYPEFFRVILDPGDTREPDLRPLRRDIEQFPVDQRNFDALNAVAIAYFELNYRAEADPGGSFYLGNSFRATHLVAIPWSAYGKVADARFRDAVLDFFEDAASGTKLGTTGTAPRLERIVASLEAKEGEPGRRARIRRLTAEIRSRSPEAAAAR